ncbi:MAG: YggT family protein [Clostridia bacterium]|nr:YggT family protein [Clostridia bacterium]
MTLIMLVRSAFDVYSWIIIARILMSWVPHNPNHPVMRFIYEVTEPLLAPIRNLMPRTSMPIDFSPIIAVLLLNLVQRLIIGLLISGI